MGIVTNVNQEITRILNYSKTDIINHNINVIMPKVYGDKHNEFMKRYFESSIPHILNNDRIVFPINK